MAVVIPAMDRCSPAEKFDEEAVRRAATIAELISERFHALGVTKLVEQHQQMVQAKRVLDDRSISVSPAPGVIGEP
jgi:hypothetical protein